MNSVEGTETDVKRRISIAREIFQMLSKVRAAKDLSKALKIEVFEMLVLSSLLYNSETSWNRFKVFEMVCLWKTEGVSRRDRIRNTEIQNRLN